MHNPKGPSTAPESHVTEEDLMSKPCESGNANASDVTPQECFFEIEDDNGTKVLASPVAAKKTKSSSGKREIQEFLEKHEMYSLERLDERTKFLKIRSKIFNERKTTRLRTFKELNEMKSMKKQT